jgi:hypothetical protein
MKQKINLALAKKLLLLLLRRPEKTSDSGRDDYGPKSLVVW